MGAPGPDIWLCGEKSFPADDVRVTVQAGHARKRRLMERTGFRESLNQRLEATGLTATELARRTGVSKAIIDKLRQRKS